MHPTVVKGFLTVALTAFFAGSGSASPLNSKLLPLVPGGAEIVAGFENHPGPYVHGRLLLTTHNNRLDLDDWQALTGVDNTRIFDEIIEVAASPAEGKLSEHLLLVAGRFDRERIFRSAEQNGAHSTGLDGQRVLLIKPFARERGDMLDDRWLVILDNRIGMLGTPWLVQQALRRYADHSVPDPVLEERLTLLRPDVTSWNVIVPAGRNAKRIKFALPDGAWAQLQQDADVLMVGARFGARIRVDFSIHAKAERGAEFFTRKAAFFTDALAFAPGPESTPPEAAPQRLQNYSLESNRVQGSVELSTRQFQAWCDQLYRVQAPALQTAANGN
jgi:hypothetical protein